MKLSFHISSAFVIALLGSGCATMFMGAHQRIQVLSDPPGATVKVDNYISSTPTILKLRRKYDHFITIEKSGYDPIYAKIDSHFNFGLFLNVLILFPPGMIVDAATGASWSLTPDDFNVKLKLLDPQN